MENIIKEEPNNKMWTNIAVVENGYVIDFYGKKYSAETLKKLLEILSKELKKF